MDRIVLVAATFVACAAAAACSGPQRATAGKPTPSTLSLADTPPAVWATIQVYAPLGGAEPAVEKETEDGLETWSAEYHTGDRTIEITALADGTLVSVEQDVALQSAPASVRRHAATSLGAEATSLERLRLAVYELESSTAAGGVRERFVDPFGSVLLERSHGAGTEAEIPRALGQVPAAARAAMESEARGASLKDVHEESVDGQPVYAASFHEVGGDREVSVLGDGTVLSLEIPTGPVPPRVAAVAAGATQETKKQAGEGSAAAPAVERMLLEAWEATAKVGGLVHEALILPTGEILGRPAAKPAAKGAGD